MNTGSTLIENVEFRATAPRRALPGLDEALTKLERMSVALKTLQGQMAGINTRSVFKLDARQFEATMRQFGAAKGQQSVKKVARLLGFPDPEDILRYAQEIERGLQTQMGKIQRRLEKGTLGKRATDNARAELRRLQAQSYFTDASATVLKNPRKGGEFFAAYATPALKNIQQTERWIAAALGGATPLTVDAGALNEALKSAAAQRSEPAQGRRAAPAKTGGAAAPLPKASGNLIEERVDTRGGMQRVRRRYLENIGKTLDEFWQDTEKIGTVTTTSGLRKAKDKFNRQFAALRRELDEQLALPANQRSRAHVAKVRERTAAEARAFVAGRSGEELERLGLGGMVDRANAFAARQTRQAAKDYAAAQQELAVEARKVFQLRKELDAARVRGEKAEARRLQRELRQIEQRAKSLGAFNAAGGKSAAAAAAMAQKVSAFDLKQNQKRQFRAATTQAAQSALSEFLAGGGTVVSTKAAYKGAPGRVTAEKVDNGMVHTLTVTYGKAGATANITTKAVHELREQVGLLSGDFVKNTIKVTAWAASVGALYGTLGLVKSGFTSTLEIGAQMARLDQVFTKIGGSTQALARDVIGLAAVYGRSSKEAMDAAIQWSRMGLTRVQVQEAVRVSLMAANVAELSAAEATDHLQAIMRNFNLQVGELRAKLGELNQISNTYNVTNKDMLEGISRSAAVAKQAGLPFEELMGIIGATVGATKQSGSQVGNALKTMMLSLSNPDLQKKLRSGFGFEMTTGGEDIKDMSRALADLYVHYSRLNELEKQSLLFQVGGKFQANRMAAMLDNYVRAQLLAIDAQMNLNSAEAENEKITGTLKAQLTGLTTEWQKFVLIQSDGPVRALTEITRALRGVLALMNTPAGGALTTGLMGLFTAASAKTLLTGLALKGNQGFIGKTGQTIMAEVGAVNGIINAGVQRFVTSRAAGRAGMGAPAAGLIGPMPFNPAQLPILQKFVYQTNKMGDAALKVGAQMRAAGTAGASFFTVFGAGAKLVGTATLAVREFLIPLAVITIGVLAFNRATDLLGLTSDRLEGKLGKLSAQAQKFGAAAGAYDQAIRLVSTATKAFKPAGAGQFPVGQAQQMLEAVAQVSQLGEDDDKKRRAGTAEMEKQLKLLYQQGETEKILNSFSRIAAQLQERRHRQLLQQLHTQTAINAATEAEIERLKAKRGGALDWLVGDKREKHINELSSQLNEGQNKSMGLLQDEEQQRTDEIEKQLAYSLKHQSALQAQKLTLEAIAGLYDQIHVATPMEKGVLESAKLTAQILALTQHQRGVEDRLRNEKPGQAERDAKAAELQQQLDLVMEERRLRSAEGLAMAERFKRLDQPMGQLMTEVTGLGLKQLLPSNQLAFGDAWERAKLALAPSGWEQMLLRGKMAENVRQQNDLKQKSDNLTSDLAKARSGTLPGMTRQDDRNSLEKLSQQDEQDLLAKKAELEATQKNLDLRRRQTVFGLGQSEVGRGATAASFGLDETDKLLREQAYYQARINELKNKTNRSEFEHGELIEATTRLQQTRLSLLDRQANLQREINQLQMDGLREFQKSFFTSGPAEMLRKLAAFRFNQRPGLSAGAFFGLGAGLRQDISQLNPQFNPEMIALRQEKARLEAALKDLKDKGQLNQDGSLSDKGANDFATQFAEGLKQALVGLDKTLLGGAPDILKTAGDVMDRAVNKFDAAVDRLVARMGGGGPAPAPTLVPAPANSGGTLGGTFRGRGAGGTW